MWEKSCYTGELRGKVCDEPPFHLLSWAGQFSPGYSPWGRAAKQKYTLTFVAMKASRVSSHTALAPAHLCCPRIPFNDIKHKIREEVLRNLCCLYFIFSNGQCVKWGAWGGPATPHFNPSLVEQLWIQRPPFHPPRLNAAFRDSYPTYFSLQILSCPESKNPTKQVNILIHRGWGGRKASWTDLCPDNFKESGI